jgi:DNA-binding MarR family transcriptional regulator/GNAT superfamily N-acetyltransferase
MDGQVAAIRRFNRFYTKRVGALDESLHDSGLSLAEARLLYEIANREASIAAELARDLSIDPGYLSRLLRGFEERCLVRREASPTDARQSILHLTEAGREIFSPLDRRSREAVGTWLDGKPAGERSSLVAAMQKIEAALGGKPVAPAPLILREHRPGDIGWVIHRQGVLYTEEYGWDVTYEALVAEILAQFVNAFDPAKERAWIAEQAGAVVGSVFLVGQSAEVAKLRLLYVEPSARGQGLGRHLVEECIRFAGAKGYRTLTLWTNDILTSARRIYEKAGFRLVAEEPHKSFGKELVGQTWELNLQAARGSADGSRL